MYFLYFFCIFHNLPLSGNTKEKQRRDKFAEKKKPVSAPGSTSGVCCCYADRLPARSSKTRPPENVSGGGQIR